MKIHIWHVQVQKYNNFFSVAKNLWRVVVLCGKILLKYVILSFHERMWFLVGPIFYNEEKLLMKYYFFQFNIFAGIKIVWMSQFLKGRNLKDWAIQGRYHKDLTHMRQFPDCWNTFVSVFSHRTIFPQRKQTISLAFDTSTLWILDQ